MDWSRFFHFSLADFRRLISRRTVILVVMAILLYQGVGIFYNLLKLQLIQTGPAPAAAEKAKPATAPIRETADAYRIIPERNLFGTTTSMIADKQTVAVQQRSIEQLIELKGTVAGEGKFGFAIVEEKGTRKQKLVKSGDILSGAKVVRIKRNAVDFLVGDQVVTLKIVEAKEDSILPPAQSAASMVPSGATILSRTEVDRELQDMGGLLRKALVRPYFNAGVPDGFIVSNIRLGSLYQKMGIMDGDIIQEVNSRKIQSADDVMGLLNTMRGGSSLSVTINRRGNKETLNYQFQ
ncbi:MAG: PDZ domain-containing protein [Syntrophales bacterium]|nr:PDZ domain-containing protein [Syntrophales bacterium]